jgi:hypothetical protein
MTILSFEGEENGRTNLLENIQVISALASDQKWGDQGINPKPKFICFN